MTAKRLSLSEVFDSGPITPLQIQVYFLCLCIVFFDGFDLVVISVALPKIAQFLKVGTSGLGLAVGAGQLGPLVGAMVLGTLADKFGRKKMLLISAVIFGVFTIAIATIHNVPELALYRFLSGVGLGGAVPNALAFGCEYAPTKKRATFTTIMWTGMPLGSVISGFVAAYLLPTHGWQSLFFLGGFIPLVVTLLVAPFLPESIEYLVRQGTDKKRIAKLINRIAPKLGADENTEFIITEGGVQSKKAPKVSVASLFAEGRAFTTACIWALFFFSFYLLWVLIAWTPTLLKKTGCSVQQYSIAFSMLHVGSLVTALVIGRLMDRFNVHKVLIITFLIAFVSVCGFGYAANGTFLVIAAMAAITGLFVNGGNTGLLALCTTSYPSSMRGSGIGWAYGVGKVGSMLGPVVGGFMLALGWSVTRICVVNAFVAVLIAAIIFVMKLQADHVAATKPVSQTVGVA
ncbi:MAG: MFS transporter [Acidobacteriota bacterium]|nr:MFS transporter [Acidobacteriota bacterium]